MSTHVFLESMVHAYEKRSGLVSLGSIKGLKRAVRDAFGNFQIIDS